MTRDDIVRVVERVFRRNGRPSPRKLARSVELVFDAPMRGEAIA